MMMSRIMHIYVGQLEGGPDTVDPQYRESN